ncbi:MAG TPA: c-type cytochrome [Candidatus Saccharimonadales bacterium]|nr:c-type cytochrome [Candidatus Saccharimonadales bacterium]
MTRTTTWIRTAALSALALSATIGMVSAQIPDKFTNLKVLPKDITKEELVARMRSFSGGLGVRCSFCHVDDDEAKKTDFASDEKDKKDTARVMMKMVTEINGNLLKGIKTDDDTKVEVTCQTCHHGLAVPEPIEDIVAHTIDEKGLAAGIAKYRDLRKERYGTGAYDFSERPLNELARDLAGEKKLDEALAVVQLGIEYNPDSAFSRLVLGGVYKARGQKDEALAAFQKALELDPSSEWAKRQIKALTGTEDKGAESHPDGKD